MSNYLFLPLPLITACVLYAGPVLGAEESFRDEEVLVSLLKELTAPGDTSTTKCSPRQHDTRVQASAMGTGNKEEIHTERGKEEHRTALSPPRPPLLPAPQPDV